MAKKAKKAALKGAADEKLKPSKTAVKGGEGYILRAREIGERQERFSHPWNAKSELFGVQLGKALGLKRSGVTIARMPSGKESYIPHAHHREEEWLYILSGEGVALIDEEEVPVGPGDFIAFPAPQVTHHLWNAGAEDLVYLMGGEHAKMDIVDFPTLGKRLVRAGGEVTAYPMEAGAVISVAKPKSAKKSKS